MDTAAVFQLLTKHFADQVRAVRPETGDAWIEVAGDHLVDVGRFLRDEPALAFSMLNCISGVDYYVTIPKKGAKIDWEPHVEVIYHLSSLKHRQRLTLKVILPRWKDDQPGNPPEVASVSGIWSTADWHEREVFDLMGVRFVGHPDPRRILCPEDWVGHPLRKDYEMPTEYHGIRAR